MTRILRLIAVVVVVLSGGGATYAQSTEDKGLNFYFATGPNFVIPTSVRAGWNRWEVGLLTRAFIGVNKTFPLADSALYAGFGIGTNIDPFSKSVGFQASVGFNYVLFWGIGIRGEMLANANLNGNTMGHGLLGVSYGF
jgi:hypothetical protein